MYSAFQNNAFQNNAFQILSGGATPVNDNGWLGGPTNYAVRKRHLEELDRIDEKIRLNRIREAAELLSGTPSIPVKIPEIRKINKQFLKDFIEARETGINIELLKAEIALIREYILAQQAAFTLQREMDDELAFMLLLQ